MLTSVTAKRPSRQARGSAPGERRRRRLMAGQRPTKSRSFASSRATGRRSEANSVLPRASSVRRTIPSYVERPLPLLRAIPAPEHLLRRRGDGTAPCFHPFALKSRQQALALPFGDLPLAGQQPVTEKTTRLGETDSLAVSLGVLHQDTTEVLGVSEEEETLSPHAESHGVAVFADGALHDEQAVPADLQQASQQAPPSRTRRGPGGALSPRRGTAREMKRASGPLLRTDGGDQTASGSRGRKRPRRSPKRMGKVIRIGGSNEPGECRATRTGPRTRPWRTRTVRSSAMPRRACS